MGPNTRWQSTFGWPCRWLQPWIYLEANTRHQHLQLSRVRASHLSIIFWTAQCSAQTYFSGQDTAQNDLERPDTAALALPLDATLWEGAKALFVLVCYKQQLSRAWEIPQLADLGIAGCSNCHLVNLGVNALITQAPPLQPHLYGKYLV